MATMASNAKVPMIDIGANLLDPMFRGVIVKNKNMRMILISCYKEHLMLV